MACMCWTRKLIWFKQTKQTNKAILALYTQNVLFIIYLKMTYQVGKSLCMPFCAMYLSICKIMTKYHWNQQQSRHKIYIDSCIRLLIYIRCLMLMDVLMLSEKNQTYPTYRICCQWCEVEFIMQRISTEKRMCVLHFERLLSYVEIVMWPLWLSLCVRSAPDSPV